MATKQEITNELIVRLREQGLRITPQRIAILGTIIDSKEHLSAEEIYNQIHDQYPMIGLATVYKTIALLKEMGEITELSFRNQVARYEIHDTPDHPHFICTGCGCIVDLEYKILDYFPETIAKETGLKIVKTRLEFYGLCQNCQSG